MADPVSLEWFGCTTFRLRSGSTTLFLDAYLDRFGSAPKVGLTAGQVTEADFVFVSHSHFDHLLGADVIARNTGATIVGSYHTTHVLAAAGVRSDQLLPVSGGETIECGPGLRVQVFPGLHSCLFSRTDLDSATECLGGLGVSHQQRLERIGSLFKFLEDPEIVGKEVVQYMGDANGRSSWLDGGQLVYLVETPTGSVLFSASSGCWTSMLRELRPDVALLAIAGRPNVDGEPFQGSMAEFIVREVELLRPDRVMFCHHDVILPPLMNAHRTEAAARAIGERTPWTTLIDMSYATPRQIVG